MKFVDLFSGCGGLSLGMERAGGELVAAVEKSDMAARTFFHNYVSDASDVRIWQQYLQRSLRRQLEGKVIVSELANVLSADELMEQFKKQDLDAVVGGPPCQGFSLAGRRLKDDIRNRLAWEYLDFVERTEPKAVVIENVVGMSHSFVKGEESSFSQLQTALTNTGAGYIVQAVRVNAVHYGAPQFRPRLMLIALRVDIAKKLRVGVTTGIWKSDFADLAHDVPALAPAPTTLSGRAFTIRDAISDLGGWEGENRGRNREYLAGLKQAEDAVRTKQRLVSDQPFNQTPRRHTDTVITRFSFYRMLHRNGVDQRLLSQMSSVDPEGQMTIAKRALASVEFPLDLQCSARPRAERTIRSLDELVELAVELVTRKHSQKVLSASEPSRTVVTLPDDYVHPMQSRIFTVRELARFQGFPDSFEFLGRETTGAHRRKLEVPQYTQVGNAVSPWQSYAVGNLLSTLLAEYQGLRAPKAVVSPES
ncbi:DNA cytosine methyltransferase [Pseudarthrobacter polychromogenes]|uniref:Cytosine-specific methyltransferase n=1 Tax=Pseudarthrobacter polychromogenes TaxID=1676 RepID=A0ABQ1Y422_9MICC|nr:DNA cytosine methyltransferase [Pseudarthrobacter polychromogenes]GGH10820.1 cytosine-specific methyltransferase [Pseudarthrobacter polychromogenes]